MSAPTGRAQSSEVLIIGGGVVGLATARVLAGEGIAVSLIERGRLDVAQGSSRGSSRIIAPAGYPDPSYLDLALRALAAWRTLEDESGRALVDPWGALYAGAGVEEFVGSFAAAGVEIERLALDQVEKRFGVHGLEAEPILFQPTAGVIRADRAFDALRRSAEARGARLCEEERAVALELDGDGVTVVTESRTWRCDRVVVTAGPWTAPLLASVGIEVGVSVSSQSVAYFPIPAGAERMPALMEFDGDEPYSLPDPKRGLKAALHRRGPSVDPDAPWEVVDTEALARIEAWVRARFPAITEPPTRTEACLYTNSTDERFVCERHGPIVVGSACSGQGFQFAPATAELLAGMLDGDGSPGLGSLR